MSPNLSSFPSSSEEKLRMKSVFNNKKKVSLFVHFFFRYNTRSFIHPNLPLFIATTRYFALKCRLSRLRFRKLRTFHYVVNHSAKCRYSLAVNKKSFCFCLSLFNNRFSWTCMFIETSVPGIKVPSFYPSRERKRWSALFTMFYALQHQMEESNCFFVLIQLKQENKKPLLQSSSASFWNIFAKRFRLIALWSTNFV